MSDIPYLQSGAKDLKAELDTLASGIAFSELQAMREASKTGGALGQVSERELDLLSSTLGAISQEQSPQALRNNLAQIKGSVVRFYDAVSQQGGFESPYQGEQIKVVDPDGNEFYLPIIEINQAILEGYNVVGTE